MSYFRFPALHGIAEAPLRYGISHISSDFGPRDISGAVLFLTLSAKNGRNARQCAVACMAENAIGPFSSVDLGTAVRYHHRWCNLLSTDAACFGFFLESGCRIPADFTVAAENGKKAAHSGNVDGINSFRCCIESGKGVNGDIARAVFYYRSAVLPGDSDGMCNHGRRLEYGKSIHQDPILAAKYYHVSAEKENAAAQNSFRICLECAHQNLFLAAHFYRRSAEQGHADDANNHGFCLEHGRGIQQNIEIAASYDKVAASFGHPEAGVNRERCLRLLDKWELPNRSSESPSYSRSADHLFELSRDVLQHPDPRDEKEQRFVSALE